MHNEKVIGCWRGWTGLGHVGRDCIEFITAINGLGCARLGGAELSGAMGGSCWMPWTAWEGVTSC